MFLLFPGSSVASGNATAQLTVDTTSGKVPLTVHFDGSGSTGVVTWSITFGDGDSDSGALTPPSDLSHTYTTQGTYTATLTVDDGLGGTDSASVTVTASSNVKPTAVLSSTPTPATGKAPLSVTFNGSTSSDSDGTIASWSLNFGDGNSVNGSGAPPSSQGHTYAAGSRTATLTVTDNDGATDTDTVAVNSVANVVPVARLTSTPTPATGKAPLSVTFNGSTSSDSDGTIASWSLNFGDGSAVASGLGAPPVGGTGHTYAAGSRTATLTVTDDNGGTDTDTVAVNAVANIAPVARLASTPTPASGKAPLNVTFNGSTSSDSDGSIASWSLDFGDGNSVNGSGAPPSSQGHTYAAGSRTATLTVTDDNGGTDTDTVAVNAVANVAPVARLSSTPTPATGKAPLNVTFNGSTSSDSDGTIASWSLNFGDGNSAGGSGAPPASQGHAYAVGNFTATLTVTDDNGQPNTNTASIAVTSKANVAPVARLTSSPSPATGNPPLNVTFNGSTSSDSDGTIASWSLNYGDGSTVSSGSGLPPSSISHSYGAGTFTATLTVTDDNGATGQATITVTVNALPTASLSVDKTSGPAPLAATFTLGGSDSDGTIASWTLDFGDSTTAASGSGGPPATVAHTYTVDANRTYTARLTVVDNRGASASATTQVTVAFNNPPTADLRAAPITGTTPLDVTFDASHSADSQGGSIASWSINFDDGTSTGPRTDPLPSALVHTYTNTTNATLTRHPTLTVSDGTKTATSSLTVTVAPLPTITIADKTATEGQVEDFIVTLSAVSTHDITVDYTTVDGTATAGSGDYTPVSGTLLIPAGTCGPGTTVCKVSVQTRDDTLSESDETFTVKLSNPQGATFTKDTGIGKILDNDPPPTIAVGNAARIEGRLGQQPPMVFNVYLCDANPPPPSFDVCKPATSGATVTAQFTTIDGSSNDPAHTRVRDGIDYVGKTGTVTFNPGQTQTTISVNVIGNNTPQAALRWFFINLSSPVGASIDTLTLPASGTIIDDDPATPAPAPIATTGDASNLGLNKATVSGTVNPNGTHTGAWLEYGPAAVPPDQYPFRVPAAAPAGQAQPTINVGSDSSPHGLSFNLTGLTQGTAYGYRIVAQNDDQSIGYGDARTFVTLTPPPPQPPPGPPPPPCCSTPPPPPPPPGKKKVGMSVNLVTRTATPTANGMLSLKFSCKGNAAKRCVADVFIDLNGTQVASKKIRLVPGKQTIVPFKMNARIFRLLLLKKKLRINVGYTYSNGLSVSEVKADDKRVSLNAPKKVTRTAAAPKRK